MLLGAFVALTSFASAGPFVDPGSLVIAGKDGKPGIVCPLERTVVDANVAGFGARVTVTQTFANPSTTPIEAIYTFPLPADAAVDRMRIQIGTRVIEGTIKRREEARRIYEAAKNQGQTAALLDQERQNIFTQSVANITPGQKVKVEISYSQILPYEHGQFEFNFPMVVGPRYLGNAADPGKIAPPITPKGTRTGSNIDLTVNLQAGAPIQSMEAPLHQTTIQKLSPSSEIIKLAKRDEIPNRDFILRYKVATDQVQSAFMTHTDPQKGGFFSLVLLPPQVPVARQIAPREVIFVMDQSGSQSGFPIEKSKELTLKLIHLLRPGDTFNVLAFSNDVRYLWKDARPNTEANVSEAEKFIRPMSANGGTELRKAVVAALDFPEDTSRLRLVVFNTDGFVGDEKQILDSVQKHRRNTRMFTFGIGNSVNHFLIDAMSYEGKGDSETVTLAENCDPAVQRFLDRTQTPVLTNVEAKIDGVPVSEMSPTAMPDVFAGRPVVVYGRYAGSGPAHIVVTGKLGGKPWTQTMEVNFPAHAEAPALMGLWARRKVDDLTRLNWTGLLDGGEARTTHESEIVDTALEFGIMTEFTSFVAVEPRVVNIGGKMRTVRVPIEMADGVKYVQDSSGFVAASPPALYRGRAGGAMGGGGGFGGGASVGQAQSKVTRRTGAQGIVYTDSTLGKPLSPAEKAKLVESLAKANFETKVEKSLRSKTGQVEVMIYLSEDSDAIVKSLKDLGFKVDLRDKKLRVLFGSCDAKLLQKLAQLDTVERIAPIE